MIVVDIRTKCGFGQGSSARESGERSHRGELPLVGAYIWVLSVQYAGRCLDKLFGSVIYRSTR